MRIERYYTPFCAEIQKLMASNPVSATDIERASKMFAKFQKYNLTRDKMSILKFALSSYQYFLLIIKHALHWGKISSYECQLNVKIALNTFVFVVNKTKSYSHIIGCLAKYFFDQLFKEFREFDFIQEFLKVYVGCLNNVPERVLDQLACKHKNLHLLANILKEAHETNLQAVIIAILLKFSHDSRTSLLEHLFPEFRLVISLAVNDNFQKIRMILEELNENSTKIFSIYCRSLMLDNYLVLEFESTILQCGVWLDVDLSFKTLSFFCSPSILSEFTSDITFGLTTNWEFVSFKAEDCLEAAFTSNYDDVTKSEILEINIKIKISKINLFRNVKDDKILHLVFKIANNSKICYTFIMDILPQLFPNFLTKNFACILAKASEEVPDEDSYMNILPEVEHSHSTQKTKSNTKEKMLFNFIPSPKENKKHTQTMRPSMCAFNTQELKIKKKPRKKTPTAKGNCAKQSSFKDLQYLERILGNENAALKSGVQEKNKQKNVEKLGDKSLKTCQEKVAVVSTLSAQSSSRPRRVPVATPSNERKRAVTATQSSVKRQRENEGASNWTIKNSSNIVGNETNKIILQSKPSNNVECNSLENLSRCYCCILGNKKNCALLDFMSKHVKTGTDK